MKNRIKQLTKKVLSALGIHLTRNQRYDALSLRVMQRVVSHSSNCVDVGAHKGEILDELLKLAPNGKMFAFEPIPQMFEALQSKYVELPNVMLSNCALSDRNGTSSFQYVKTNPAYSGLRKRTYLQKETIEEISVQNCLLDEVIPKDVKIDFIKIDVEGGEFQVLKGAVNIIQRDRPVVIFEHGLGASDHYGTTPEMIYSLLCEQCELDITLMERFIVDAAPLSKDEFRAQFYKSLNYYFVAYPRRSV